MVHYRCRHCDKDLGVITENVEAEMLGFHHLTDAERVDMITYQEDGMILVKVICEDCHEALMRNPSMYEVDHLIQ